MTRNSTPLAVVAAALIRPDGTVLMQRRPLGKEHGGLWEFPGGKVEPQESPQSALVREIAEELGSIITEADLAVVATSGPLPHAKVPVVITLYSCRRWDAEPICLEGEEIGWFALRELPGLSMPPLDYPLAEALIFQFTGLPRSNPPPIGASPTRP